MAEEPGPQVGRFDPESIVRTLVEHEVDCVVIGGFAAGLYGSPILTQDIDITPEQGTDNLGRLSAALTALGARVRTSGVPGGLPFAHDGESLGAVSVWNLTTQYGDLDVSMTPSGTQGFRDLDRDARSMTVGGVAIRVASLADVIRSKQAANRPKDQRALPVLREILARGLAD